jgi:uncharacterized protein YgbK (DUF1537 family)
VILVLADDLAGAAEMGGMAWRHGLAAQVRTGAGLERAQVGPPQTGVDVVVLDTDTRSCPPAEAARRVFEAAARCQSWGVSSVYKKVDSVLRGPVAAELGALLEAMGFARALLVPANPGLGRVISGGQYLVDGVPLHETDFRHDPEYPATTANVLERLGENRVAGFAPLGLRAPGEALPARGIVVGEATCAADLRTWAALGLQHGVLAAGASEFFGAYLEARGYRPLLRVPQTWARDGTRELFVCGSSSAGSRRFCEQSAARGVPVLRLPHGLLDGRVSKCTADELVACWANEVVSALSTHSRAMIAIDRPLCSEPGVPQALSRYLSEAVADVLGRVRVDRLFAEGGATAVSLVRRMGWACLDVRCEWATGVVTLGVEGRDAPLVSMKPGSYLWPEATLG